MANSAALAERILEDVNAPPGRAVAVEEFYASDDASEPGPATPDRPRKIRLGSAIGGLATANAWVNTKLTNGIETALSGAERLIPEISLGKFHPDLILLSPQVVAHGS
jgi:hypothetical protein